MTSRPVKVGIVDTGVHTSHDAFATLGISGRDFSGGSDDLADELDHGTHQLGVLLQSTGLDSDCVSVTVAKVTGDSYEIPWRRVESALRWLMAQAVDLVAFGLGAEGATEAFRATVQEVSERALVVAPADSWDSADPSKILYPAQYREVIGVGKVDADSQLLRRTTASHAFDLLAASHANGPLADGTYGVRDGSSVSCAVAAGFITGLLYRSSYLRDRVAQGEGKQSVMRSLDWRFSCSPSGTIELPPRVERPRR